MKKQHTRAKFNDAVEYSAKAGKEFGPLCEVLRKTISGIMPKNSGKIYYEMPVWFVEDNPAVGYSVSKNKDHVTLLFWSGRGFKTPGLTPEGSFMAAEVKYKTISDIDKKPLRNWIEESKTVIYNYNEIRKNKGKLTLL